MLNGWKENRDDYRGETLVGSPLGRSRLSTATNEITATPNGYAAWHKYLE